MDTSEKIGFTAGTAGWNCVRQLGRLHNRNLTISCGQVLPPSSLSHMTLLEKDAIVPIFSNAYSSQLHFFQTVWWNH